MTSPLRFQQNPEDSEREGRQPAAPPPPSTRTAAKVAVVAGVLLATVVAAIAFAAIHSTRAATCRSASTDSTIREIEGYFAAGNLGTTVALSQRLLNSREIQPACHDVRIQGAAYWYAASMLGLLGKPRPEAGVVIGPMAQHETARTWTSIQQAADRFGVPRASRWPALTVATIAANEGQDELSIAATRTAWTAQMSGDLSLVGRYEQALAAWGEVLTSPADPLTHAQGEQALATSNSIAAAAGLKDDRGCRALERLGFPDCTQVAPDASDPVLATLTAR